MKLRLRTKWANALPYIVFPCQEKARGSIRSASPPPVDLLSCFSSNLNVWLCRCLAVFASLHSGPQVALPASSSSSSSSAAAAAVPFSGSVSISTSSSATASSLSASSSADKRRAASSDSDDESEALADAEPAAAAAGGSAAAMDADDVKDGMDVAGKRVRTGTRDTDAVAMGSDAGAADAVAPTPAAVIDRFGAPVGVNAIVRFYDPATYESLRLGDMIEVRSCHVAVYPYKSVCSLCSASRLVPALVRCVNQVVAIFSKDPSEPECEATAEQMMVDPTIEYAHRM